MHVCTGVKVTNFTLFCSSFSRKLGMSLTLTWGLWGLPIPKPVLVMCVCTYVHVLTCKFFFVYSRKLGMSLTLTWGLWGLPISNSVIVSYVYVYTRMHVCELC